MGHVGKQPPGPVLPDYCRRPPAAGQGARGVRPHGRTDPSRAGGLVSRFWRRIVFWWQRDRIEAELREEMETHRQLRRDALGSDAASHRALGNTTLAIEDARGVWIWPWLESALSDVRHGARSLRRQPSFSLTALLTIAVGSGALMALVALVYTVLLRPAPYANADRIVQIE